MITKGGNVPLLAPFYYPPPNIIAFINKNKILINNKTLNPHSIILCFFNTDSAYTFWAKYL